MKPITQKQAMLIGAACLGKQFSYILKEQKSGIKGVTCIKNAQMTARLMRADDGEEIWLNVPSADVMKRIMYNEDLIEAHKILDRLSADQLIQVLHALRDFQG